jgi:ketosteroid isomerase-like protein
MDNTAVVLDLFDAIENRALERILKIYDPEVEFHWPRSLPYGGSTKGYQTHPGRPTWQSVWLPLQPEPTDRRMDPRVIASGGNEVAALYHQRGRDSEGNTFDGEVVGLYQLEGGRLRRAQMFYFDTDAVSRFLQTAVTQNPPLM